MAAAIRGTAVEGLGVSGEAIIRGTVAAGVEETTRGVAVAVGAVAATHGAVSAEVDSAAFAEAVSEVFDVEAVHNFM